MKFDADAEKTFLAMREARLPRFETLTPTAARELLANLRARAKVEVQPIASVEDLHIDGPGGKIPLRIYRPEIKENLAPALVYFHGGGFVIGNLESHDAVCRALALAAGVVIVSVDYRLAPEHKFPAGLHDAAAAFTYVHAEAATLGIDHDRIGVGGDSAGANLAAVLALMARDGAIAPIRIQLLACPVLDLTLSHESHAMDVEGLAVNGSTMRWFRDHYLESVSVAEDWRASPLRAESLEGVAPCHLISAGIDPLCDEALVYAERLGKAGVRFVHEHYPGQMHGFVTGSLNSPTGKRALASIAVSLRAELSV